MDTMQTSRSNPTWSNGTDAAAATTTASLHGPEMVTSTDAADSSLKKLKKKDKKARKDRNPESSLAAEEDKTSALKGMKSKKSKTAQETHVPGVPVAKDDMTVKGEDIVQPGEEATGKRKKKKRNEVAADSDSHGVATQIERDLDGVHSPNTKRLKERKRSKEAKGGVETLDDASGLREDDADRTQLDDMRTDSDWLRERTSRVLDLVSGDEPCANMPNRPASQGRERSSSYSEHETEPQMPAAPPVVQHDFGGSLANGRLFIRNLPYGAEEVEIQSLFSRYGKVNEVRAIRNLFFLAHFCDDLLIGTAYALHMICTGKSILVDASHF